MFKITKRGNLAVEAAIVLPLIILGILAVAYLIKINCTNETVMSIGVDEARKLSIESYTTVGKMAALTFTETLDQRVQENTNCSNVDTNNFKYLYSCRKIDKLISFDINYKIDCNFPISFYNPIWGKETILTRAFSGTDKYKTVKGFSVMEEMEESETVWIFPVAGQKYHKKECPYIRVAATQTILTKSIKSKYKPCSICDSKSLRKGSVVYCFFNSGESYHRPNCSTVDRYVIEIEKNDAIKQGYSPCLKCGGS